VLGIQLGTPIPPCHHLLHVGGATKTSLPHRRQEVERDMAALAANALENMASARQRIDPMYGESVGPLTGFVSETEAPQAKQFDADSPMTKQGGLRGLFVPGVRVPFGIGCTLMFFQQCSVSGLLSTPTSILEVKVVVNLFDTSVRQPYRKSVGGLPVPLVGRECSL